MARPEHPESKPRTLDPQNRVVVPNEVRDLLGVGPGDYVAFRIEGEAIRFYKADFVLKSKK